MSTMLAASPAVPLAIHRSHRLIPPFTLHRPRSAAEAMGLLARYGDAAAPLAGGIDFINRLKSGAGPAHVVALDGVAELQGVTLGERRIELGAMTTHRGVQADEAVASRLPVLADYVAGLGNVRIRAQGTLGGNVMAGEPCYEILPILMALDATLHFVAGADAAPRAVAARRLADMPAAPRLLCRIAVPLRPVTILWDRSLRPMVTMVAAFARHEGHFIEMGAALGAANLGPAWIPCPALPIAPAEARRQAVSLARGWVGGWSRAVPSPRTASESWHLRAAAALLARAITRASAES